MKTSPHKKENPRIHNISYTTRTNRVELSRTHVSRALQTPAVYLHTPFQPLTIKLQIAVLEDARVVSTPPISEYNENFDFSSKIFFKQFIKSSYQRNWACKNLLLESRNLYRERVSSSSPIKYLIPLPFKHQSKLYNSPNSAPDLLKSFGPQT